MAGDHVLSDGQAKSGARCAASDQWIEQGLGEFRRYTGTVVFDLYASDQAMADLETGVRIFGTALAPKGTDRAAMVVPIDAKNEGGVL